MAYFILTVSGFIFLTLPVTLFFSAGKTGVPSIYLAAVVSMVILAFVSYKLYRMASSREPVLVFTSEGLEMPLKNNRFIPWGEITEWKIRMNKISYSLITYTPGNKTKIDISWLDLPVKEVEGLMSRYIRQPGPHGFLR